MHSGALDVKGGDFYVVLKKGLPNYEGETKNGV